jgi:hypothetical protein
VSLYSLPTYEQSLTAKGQTSQSWYRFFSGVYQGTPPANESKVTLGASPYAYQAPAKGFVILSGGSVSAVQFTRSVTTLTGQTSGIFPLNQGDVLTITYASLPVAVWVPT